MEGEGAVFIPCRTGRGLGWRAGDHWLCQCEVEGAAISTTVGVYHYYWSEGILDQCKKWYNSQIVKVLVVLSYRVRAQLQEQCRVISLKYARVASNSYY